MTLIFIIQLNIIFFHQSKKLANLIRLRFSLDLLKVNQFRNFRMIENMMAAALSSQMKPKALD